MTYHSPEFMRSYTSGIINILAGLKQLNDGLHSLAHYQVGMVQMNTHNKVLVLLKEAKHILEHSENNPDLDDVKEFQNITCLEILIKIKDLDNYQIQLDKVIAYFIAINKKAHVQIIKNRINELENDNEAAPSWGAAVSARGEELKELYAQLENLTDE